MTDYAKEEGEIMWLIYKYEPRPATCRYCGALLGYHLRACRYWLYRYEMLEER